MSEKPFVPAVVGATASGKSAWALKAAELLNAEIVCMDSMQIYRGMDIGTAKPTPVERAAVPHHMLDIVSPKDPYAVADYARDARSVLQDILSRGKVPLLVGGTGLYLKALMHGLSLGAVSGNEALREKLNAEALLPGGKERLFEKLKSVDPKSGEKLHPNDIRRVVRALEVFEMTGKPISEQPAAPEEECPFDIRPVVLHRPREVLAARIEKRVDDMLRAGLVDEVRTLLQSGVSPENQSMQGIGYKELWPYLRGQCSLQDARWQIILNTRHYAKRQETWFRGEKRCIWLETEGGHFPPPGIDIFQKQE